MMNGTNRNTPRQGGKPSLDALNRTIEGLEARIEGLISNGKPEQPRQSPQSYSDQTQGILQRRRALEKVSLPGSGGGSHSLADDVRARFSQSPQTLTPRRAPAQQDAGNIAQALVGLRAELKKDISDSLSREMAAIRAEMRDIRSSAKDDDFVSGLHDDMEQLAASVDALSRQASPSDAETLRHEFSELRNMLDGLARQDSIRGVEAKLDRFNPEGLENEIVSLATRIDDIKAQLGGINSAPAIQALEDKLFNIAQAVEAFGKHLPPDQTVLTDQFSDIDQRLEEISQAISANMQGQAPQADNNQLHMLEERIANLGQQIEDWMSPRASNSMIQRLEALSAKIEEMNSTQTASRLEERLDQLSAMVEKAQLANSQQELTPFLSDISRKIDALESGSVSDDLADRLDSLAHRIEAIDIQAAPAGGNDDMLQRLESRLNDIAAHLNETVTQPASDYVSLQNLEDQIANLSSLLSGSTQPGAAAPELESRMATLEDYMAANDEYIVEAARQAAEAVAEAYAHKGGAHSGGSGAEIAQITALAGDLRTLEELTRSSEERNQRTFEALHDTLVQIADRIDHIGNSQTAAQSTPAMAQAAPESAPQAHTGQSYQTSAALSQPSEPATSDSGYNPLVEEDSLLEIPDFDDEPLDPAPALEDKKGLLAGLSNKFRPGRGQVDANHKRKVVEPTPPLAPSEDVSPELANQLLEPGSGAPNIQQILEKVRASQDHDGADDGDRANYIAAARRAAKAAAEQTETAEHSKLPRPRKAAGNIEEEPKAEGGSKTRRPIVLAAGAALLAIMSYQLVGPLLGGSSDEPAAVETAVSESQAEPQGAAAVAPETQASAEPELGEAMPAEIDTDVSSASIEGNESGTFAQTDDVTSDVQVSTPLEDAAPTSASAPADIAMASLALPEDIGPQSLIKAAQSNDPLAAYEVGARYAEGRSVSADTGKAIAWFERAADLGFVPAEYRLGNIYEKGLGVVKDLEKARDYYLGAAEKGNANAMHNLAVVYAVGINGQPDYEQSARWFTEAANHGVKDSQFNLAILYAKGSGVQQDLSESYKWFDIAARSGDSDAAQKRDEIAKALTPEQLKAAQTDAATWKQAPVNDSANSIVVPDEWAGKSKSTSTVDMKRAIRNIQAILNNNGFEAGNPDGIMGAKTVSAIKSFQKSIGQEPTGEINEPLVRELLARNK